MKNKLVAIVILLMLVASALPILHVSAAEVTLTLSDTELYTQFSKKWGPGTLTSKTDISGPGVRFDFTGLSSNGTGICDDFPVSQYAGGDPDNVGGWGYFRKYTQYRLVLTNLGPNPVSVNIDVNTGWTDPPWGSPQRDTFWGASWTYLAVNESKVVTLDFSRAGEVWNAQDDPVLEWRYPGGTSGVIVRRLDEVSRIGFQICGSGLGSIIVSATTPSDVVLALPDEELSTYFAKEAGPGTLAGVTDILGPGVRFDFTGLSTSTGTIVGDDFPVNALAGGAWKDYGSGFAGPYDFSAYSRFSLLFINVGSTTVKVNLKMNTGWTDPPWGSPQRDTFWQNGWTEIPAGQSRIVTLDFWSAEVWNAGDDPILEWRYADGTSGVIVRRLDEVSDIGFQILGGSDGSIVVSGELILTLSDGELSTQFAKETGPGTLTAKIDIPGPGVRFDFTGLSTSTGTVVGDNFPVSALAGGAYKTYGVNQTFSTWGDFSGYTEHRMIFTNIGPSAVTVNLKLNTGWTIPPPEYAKAWRDTFWQNNWTYIAPGESKTLTLDFSSAEVYNAGDEQEYGARSDGTTGVVVWRLYEVSDIGFQILGDATGSIIISSRPPFEPPTANFTYSPSVPKVGETVTFDASGSNANGGTITEYKWDFGDGNTTATSNSIITHVYGSLGTYTVNLTITDSEGLTDSTWQNVTVVPAITYVHDVAVTNVTVSTDRVYQGQIVSINVTVANLGNATESFNVTLYYDSNTIATQTVYNLLPNATLTLSFTWDTTGVPYCHNYTIKAEASTVPSEINVGNNVFVDGSVKVKILGDINGDGKVDIVDLVLMIKAFGSYPGHSRWSSDADFNGDGKVDIVDLVLLLKNFGKAC